MKTLWAPEATLQSSLKMRKKKLLELFKPISDDQAKLILGGMESDDDCSFYDVCGSTAGCKERRDCGNGEWLMTCEDASGCWDCRATIAH